MHSLTDVSWTSGLWTTIRQASSRRLLTVQTIKCGFGFRNCLKLEKCQQLNVKEHDVLYYNCFEGY